jgi:hypothetical protein
MTPTQAIKIECQYCMNGARGARQSCASIDCQLSQLVEHGSPLRRIKAHCLTCIPAQSFYAVKDCDGRVLNPKPHDCPLHPYRLGHNPALRGKSKGNPDALRKARAHRITGPLNRAESTNEAADAEQAILVG